MSAARSRIRVHALIDNLGFGGAEMLLPEFAAPAAEVGVDLSVGYLKEPPVGSQARERLRRLGIEPTFVPGIHSILSPRDLRNVRANIRAAAPDIVHTHLGASDALGGMAARSLGVPVVSTVHAMDWVTSIVSERAQLRLMALVRRRCDARVIVVSESARTAYLATGWDRPEHVLTIHNGVTGVPQPGAGRAVREELGIEPAAPVALMLSAMRPEKAHDVAIEAVARLARRLPGLQLVIVGDGELRPQIEQAAAASGAAVTMAGFRDDVMAVLDAADVLLHPSHVEAFPTALLEAMAAGVPIVATAVGGIPEIVRDGEAGVLVEPPPDADRVADALERVLADSALRARLGAAGRERFDAEFTVDRWAGRTRALYDEVLA